ncbi:hypothetical protein P3S68_025861 [Capsicum galapagoense]
MLSSLMLPGLEKLGRSLRKLVYSSPMGRFIAGEESKYQAPSVVFVDELDAVGRERGSIKGSGGQERDATLNQLLVCLDNFEGEGELITIALDRALV